MYKYNLTFISVLKYIILCLARDYYNIRLPVSPTLTYLTCKYRLSMDVLYHFIDDTFFFGL